ncbi:MAG TPA: ABC transporter permease [Woeseiaceae bacterium]|nr:ABC transporter permease [Woeseiaceae bacterium]
MSARGNGSSGLRGRIKVPFDSIELTLGIVFLAIILMLVVFRSQLQTHDPYVGDLLDRFSEIGVNGHLLGTDNLGRDVWSRLLEGIRWSISAAVIDTLVAFVIGTFVGLAAAQSTGWARTILNQIVDMALAFPSLIIAMIVVAVVGRGFWPLTITLGLVTWPVFARIVFAEALTLLERDYVKASKSFGARPLLIMLGHILPGLRPTLAVVLAFHFADMLVAESALSFLGLGAPLGVPTWGNLLQESRDYLMVAPWLLAVPSVGIIYTVVAVNLIGDGLASIARRKGLRIDI